MILGILVVAAEDGKSVSLLDGPHRDNHRSDTDVASAERCCVETLSGSRLRRSANRILRVAVDMLDPSDHRVRQTAVIRAV